MDIKEAKVYYSLLNKIKTKKIEREFEVFKDKVSWREESITSNLERVLDLAKVSDNIENYKIKSIEKQIINKLGQYKGEINNREFQLESQVYHQIYKIIEYYKSELIENSNTHSKRLLKLEKEFLIQRDLYIKGIEGILNDSQKEILDNIHKKAENLFLIDSQEERQKYFSEEIFKTYVIIKELTELRSRVISSLNSFYEKNILLNNELIFKVDEIDKIKEFDTENTIDNVITINNKLESYNLDKDKTENEVITLCLITDKEINDLVILDNILSEIHEGYAQDISLVKLVTKKVKLPLLKEKLKIAVRSAIKIIYKNIVDKIIDELELIEIKYIVEIEKQYCLQYGNISTVDEQLKYLNNILDICKSDISELNVKEIITNVILV